MTSSNDLDRRAIMLAASGLGLLAGAAPAAAQSAAAVQPDMVDRTFVRLAEGLAHYRSVGDPKAKNARRPILMCHAGPGSSSGLASLMPFLADNRFVIAPDMLGNGDSAAPSRPETDIGYYVDATLRLLDKVGIDRVDFYGTHTGAQIGAQMAVQHPDRVARLIMDGVPLMPLSMRQEMLQLYAPKIVPDAFGGHLLWTWNFVRNQSQYFPHYAQDPAHRLANGVGAPAQITRSVVEVLKALDTYHQAYRAAFSHDLESWMRRIDKPTLLVSSERDPLNVYLDQAKGLVKGSRSLLMPAVTTPRERADVVASFFS